MATALQNEVVFPKALRDIFPIEAQKVYIDVYKQSWNEFNEGNGNGRELSRESVAARDAWDAVRREFEVDSITHKWHRIGEQAAAGGAQTGKRSLMDAIKGVFKRQ